MIRQNLPVLCPFGMRPKQLMWRDRVASNSSSPEMYSVVFSGWRVVEGMLRGADRRRGWPHSNPNPEAIAEATADVCNIGPVWVPCQCLLPSVRREGGGDVCELLHGVLHSGPTEIKRQHIGSVGVELHPVCTSSMTMCMPASHLMVARYVGRHILLGGEH